MSCGSCVGSVRSAVQQVGSKPRVLANLESVLNEEAVHPGEEEPPRFCAAELRRQAALRAAKGRIVWIT